MNVNSTDVYSVSVYQNNAKVEDAVNPIASGLSIGNGTASWF